MKALFTKTFFLACLSLGVSSSILAQTQAPTIIPVALPDIVTVQLKEGRIISGVHLLNIDSKKQQVKLEQSDQEFIQDIKKIEKITFKGKTIIKGGAIVIRGEDEDKKQGSCGNREEWNLPLSDIKVIDSGKGGKGTAQVNLSSMSNGQRREINQRSQTLTFVVNEIQFVSTEQTNLKIAPCRAK